MGADRSGFEECVDVREAARLLGVSRSLMYAYVERNLVPHFRLGRSIRFRLSELEEWLGQFKVNGGTDER